MFLKYKNDFFLINFLSEQTYVESHRGVYSVKFLFARMQYNLPLLIEKKVIGRRPDAGPQRALTGRSRPINSCTSIFLTLARRRCCATLRNERREL